MALAFFAYGFLLIALLRRQQRRNIGLLVVKTKRSSSIPEQEFEYETLPYLDLPLLALGTAVSALVMRASGLGYLLGHIDEVGRDVQYRMRSRDKRIPIRGRRGMAYFKEAPPSVGRMLV